MGPSARACQSRRQVARASVSNDQGDDVAASAAHRCPHPASLLFVAHTPPHFLEVEHLLWGHRQKACFDLRQVLDVRCEPARTRLPRHGKEACHPTQAPALSASPQHGVVLGLPRGWLWLAHARRATVLAMVLSLPTPIGSLFDDLCPLTVRLTRFCGAPKCLE